MTVGAASTGAALHLAAPVVTPQGVERRVVAIIKRAERRLVSRSHPADSYPEPDAGDA